MTKPLSAEEKKQLNFVNLNFEWLYPNRQEREDAQLVRRAGLPKGWLTPTKTALGRIYPPCGNCSTDIDDYFIRTGLAAKGFDWMYEGGRPMLIVRSSEPMPRLGELDLLLDRVAAIVGENALTRGRFR